MGYTREDGALLAVFSFPSPILCIGEAGPAKDTTVFGVSFFFSLFFFRSCICTTRGRHRPPQGKLREAVVVFYSHCICIMALCLSFLGRWDRDTNFIPPLLAEEVQTLGLCRAFVYSVMPIHNGVSNRPPVLSLIEDDLPSLLSCHVCLLKRSSRGHGSWAAQRILSQANLSLFIK